MRLIILILCFFLTACGKDDKPKNLIEQGKMAQILADVHLAEGKINNFHLGSQDSAIVVYRHLKKQILQKYKVDTTTYKSSLKYYIINPDLLKGLYEEVKVILETQRKKIKVPNVKAAKVDTLSRTTPRTQPTKLP